MDQSVMDVLCCPQCRGDLELEILAREGDEILDGMLACGACNRRYVVARGIPRMVTRSIFSDAAFEQRYGIDPDYGLVDVRINEDVKRIQEETNEKFGHEWEHYSRFGWDDEAFDVKRSRRAFFEKTLLNTRAINGKKLLDGGCGNGRFTRIAAETGAEVYSVDLSHHVDAARDNLLAEGLPARVIQGDIFHLPFKDNVFDVMFTIGVLQHTGNAEQAFYSLNRTVKPDGLVGLRVYERGNQILERFDAMIRNETTRFTNEELHEFSKILFDLAVFLDKKDLLKSLQQYINIFNDEHSIFDWYAAPVAEKLTYDEIYQWFANAGCETVRDRNRKIPNDQLCFSAISILGRKLPGDPPG